MIRFFGQSEATTFRYGIGSIHFVRSWAAKGHREKVCIKWRRYERGPVYQCTLNGLYLESELMSAAEFEAEYPELVV